MDESTIWLPVINDEEQSRSDPLTNRCPAQLESPTKRAGKADRYHGTPPTGDPTVKPPIAAKEIDERLP